MSGVAPHSPQNPTVVYVEKKSGWGCFVWGCLIVALLMVLLVIGSAIGVYYYTNTLVRQYTSDQPAAIPAAQISAEELERIEAEVQTFKQEIEKGNAPPPLVLTADQINGMIERNDDFKGKAHVMIDNDLVTGQISMPADILPLGIGKGRYFNATATLDVSIEDGELDVRVMDASVNGQQLPAEVLSSLKSQNLAKDVKNDPKVNDAIKQFDRLEIKDNKVILTPRAAPQPPVAQPPAIPPSPVEPPPPAN